LFFGEAAVLKAVDDDDLGTLFFAEQVHQVVIRAVIE
jgi:hypothetical protein